MSTVPPNLASYQAVYCVYFPHFTEGKLNSKWVSFCSQPGRSGGARNQLSSFYLFWAPSAELVLPRFPSVILVPFPWRLGAVSSAFRRLKLSGGLRMGWETLLHGLWGGPALTVAWNGGVCLQDARRPWGWICPWLEGEGIGSPLEAFDHHGPVFGSFGGSFPAPLPSPL